MVAAARLAALLAAALAAAPSAAAEFDIPWFDANPSARRETLRTCANDARADRRVCENAERAESKDYARRLARRSGVRGALPDEFQTPLVRDAIKAACARPPRDRGLYAAQCGRRM